MKGCGTKGTISDTWPKLISYSKDINCWKQHVQTSSGICYYSDDTCKLVPDNEPIGVVDSHLCVQNAEGL